MSLSCPAPAAIFAPMTPAPRLAVLMLCPGLAMADPMALPFWSQSVALDLPPEFQQAYAAEQGDYRLAEFVPRGQTVEAWRQMITITAIRGAAQTHDAVDEANRLAGQYRAACPETFAHQVLTAPEIAGAQASFAAYLGCGDLAGQSEAMVFVAMRGAKDIYSVQWAERGLGLEATLNPDMTRWQDRAATLAASRLCDPADRACRP